MKPANIIGPNKDAKIYVGRSSTVHNLLFCAYTLCMNYVKNTFLLVSSSVRNKQLLYFVQGHTQKSEQKHTAKNSSNPVALPDIYFHSSIWPIASFVVKARALFLLYHLLLRSPITERVWKATGLLNFVEFHCHSPLLTMIRGNGIEGKVNRSEGLLTCLNKSLSAL